MAWYSFWPVFPNYTKKRGREGRTIDQDMYNDTSLNETSGDGNSDTLPEV